MVTEGEIGSLVVLDEGNIQELSMCKFLSIILVIR